MFKQLWKRLSIGVSIAIVTIALATSQTLAAQSYTVQRGDTLWKLSVQYNTDVATIRALNGLGSQSTLYPGQTLRLPDHGERVHIVSRGESLWKIASWYNSSVADIQRANQFSGTTIRPGQALVIPSREIPTGHSVSAAAASTVQSMNAVAQTQSSGATTPSLNDATMDLFARLVTAEAWAEPYEGKVAVAAVVLNRVASPKFPNSIVDVIYQPRQFEPVLNGFIHVHAIPESKRAIQDALNGWDPSRGALFFYSPSRSNHSFFTNNPSLQLTARIGSHWFYK